MLKGTKRHANDSKFRPFEVPIVTIRKSLWSTPVQRPFSKNPNLGGGGLGKNKRVDAKVVSKRTFGKKPGSGKNPQKRNQRRQKGRAKGDGSV